MIGYRKNFKYYMYIIVFVFFSIYLVWLLGSLFITNIKVSKPNSNSYKIYQNSFNFKPIPIYILQLGVYNNIKTAQNDAEKFSANGVVTYLSSHESYRLICDIYTKEKFLNEKKELFDKKGFNTFVVKDLILNDKQFLSISEKENLHNQLNLLYTKYSQWLINNELYWITKDGLNGTTAEEVNLKAKKTKIINDLTEIDFLFNRLSADIKEDKLKGHINSLFGITKQYKETFMDIDNGSSNKGDALAKGQLLSCWDQFQYLYKYISDDRRF